MAETQPDNTNNEAADDVLSDPTLQVKLGEEPVSLGDLMVKAQQAEKLEGYRKSVRDMLLADPNSAEYRQAAEQVLRDQGFSEPEIQDYLSPAGEPEPEGGEDVDEILKRYERDMGVGGDDDDDEEGEAGSAGKDPRVEALSAELKALKQQVATQTQQAQAGQHERYTKTLEQNVNTQLDQNERLGVVFEALKRHNSSDPEYLKKVRPKYAAQVQERALQILRDRVAREGEQRFREGWIESATAQAATAVGEDLAAVIGNLDTLGRSPETVSQMKVPLKEVPAPKPGTPSTVAEAEKGLEDWLNYRINLAARGGGDTKA